MNYFRFILILFSLASSAQENTLGVDSILKGKNNSDLKSIFYDSFDEGDFAKANSIASFTLNKAKKDKDTIDIINSYIRLCRSDFKDFEKSKIYIDSSIYLSEKVKNLNLKSESYFFKGQLYENNKLYEDALKNYIKADKLYTDLKNEKAYMSIRHMIGMLKLRVGNYNEALEIIKESFSYEKENLDENNNLSYITILHDLSIVYAANSMYDSASVANKQGFNLAKKNKHFNELYFTQLEGGNLFFKKKYNAAKDSLLKSIPFLEKKKDINLSIVYFFLGRIAELNKDIEKAIYYFKEIDSIFTNTDYILDKPRPAYETLINYSKKNKELKKQLYYLNRLLRVDSILDIEHRGLLNTFHKEYDTPKLISEKKELIDILNKKNNSYKNIILYVLFFLVTSILFAFYNINKKKKNEKKYLEIISSLKEKKVASKAVGNDIKGKKVELDVDKDTVKVILDSLKLFEQEKGFLKPKLTLNNLSEKIEIHSRYVSKVINYHKGKNVQNYINDLRVEYAISKLKNDRIFRNFTIKAIAEEVGFSNTESFTKAFRKKTTLNVSYFINKINT